MTWSRDHARNSLGHYDPAHNAIVVSRIFDHPRVPRYAVEYIVYHEMLHLKHPVRLRGSRRCVHSAEFQAEEKLFPQLDEVKRFLRTSCLDGLWFLATFEGTFAYFAIKRLHLYCERGRSFEAQGIGNACLKLLRRAAGPRLR